MTAKILAAVVAVALMAAYLAPMVFKMKDAALTIVIVLGIAATAADVWYTLRNPDD